MADKVSENIDKLLAQMADVATGTSDGEKARAAFHAAIADEDKTEEQAWVEALISAGASRDDTVMMSAADSIVMGGWDYAGMTKYPDHYVVDPNIKDWSRMSAYNEFKGCGLSDAVCRQLLQLWEEYYTSKDVMDKIQPGPEIQLEARGKGPSSKGFVQIGGDFGDPWDSGGTWFNPETGVIIHHPELSEAEWKGVDAEDPKIDPMVTPKNYQDIAASLSAEHDEKWEDTENDIREGHAAVFNDNRSFTYYQTTTEPDDVIERDWEDDIVEIKSQWGDDGERIWSELTPEQKIASIAEYKGWHEFDYDNSSATKAELSVILGIDL